MSTDETGLVVVSNRLPVQRAGSTWKASAGGLVTALRPVVAKRSTTWVGWDGGSRDLPEHLPGTEARLAPVPLSRDVARGYYDGFANATLWPLFHNLVGTPEYDDSYWRAYQRANQAIAEATAEATGKPKSDLVWVHDYHLMLLPALLRESGMERIRFFLHIPWPAPELFSRLPWRADLLRGLLGAEVLSFHTDRYRKNFVRCCGRLLGDEVTVRGKNIELADGRVVRTIANAISIDVDEFTDDVDDPGVARSLVKLDRQFKDRYLMLGVDRLDYTKGILNRLLAFERLLERRSDLRGKISLVQVAVPSREDVRQYRELREQVELATGRINGRFTEPGEDVPVHYFHRGVPREALLAYYQLADQMLVTPVEDGMNLVAKEYVVVTHAGGHRDGALVLSEFTGAANEMREAYMCNPFDIEGTSRVMEEVLDTDAKDRRRRIQQMARRVRRLDIHRWAATELEVETS
jgi:trehalose 6-phosphate synthase